MTNNYKILVWSTLWLLSITIQACVDCDTVDPMPTEPVRFVIVDQKWKNLVTDNNSRYSADSIKLFRGNEQFILSKQFVPDLGGYVFDSYPPNDPSNKTELHLYLNHLDLDTLTTYYEHHKSKCGSYYSYTGFELNDAKIEKPALSGIIRIIKPD